MKVKQIGFFGGTFDPIHFGHLNLAITLLEKAHLDGIVFCPAHHSPFKSQAKPRSSKMDRKEMVLLAISSISQFSFLDWELVRETPSYTIETIRFLTEQNSKMGEKIQYRLILGEDVLEGLQKWKEIEELIALAPPLIGSRLENPPALHHLSHSLRKAVLEGMVKIPILEISSTTIRERLEHKKYCGHLVPEKVLDYIYKNNSY
jgi:nicotinate-nucleotide adenylyltransferase